MSKSEGVEVEVEDEGEGEVEVEVEGEGEVEVDVEGERLARRKSRTQPPTKSARPPAERTNSATALTVSFTNSKSFNGGSLLRRRIKSNNRPFHR